MSTATAQKNDETLIRELLDDWAKAVRVKEVARIMSFYAPDLVSFDAIGPLQFKGVEAYREHWETCMASCQGTMKFDIHELDVSVSGDVAFARFLNHCGAIDLEGKEQAGWLRATSCLRKLGGKWTVVHEHFSAPFDPESCKAQFDLQPA